MGRSRSGGKGGLGIWGWGFGDWGDLLKSPETAREPTRRVTSWQNRSPKLRGFQRAGPSIRAIHPAIHSTVIRWTIWTLWTRWTIDQMESLQEIRQTRFILHPSSFLLLPVRRSHCPQAPAHPNHPPCGLLPAPPRRSPSPNISLTRRAQATTMVFLGRVDPAANTHISHPSEVLSMPPTDPERKPAAADSRRGFGAKIAAVCLGALAFAGPVCAAVVSFLNPLKLKGQGGRFFFLTTLESLPEDGTPQAVSR